MTRSDTDTVFLIDPDEAVHDAIATLLDASGMRVVCFSTAEAFLASRLMDKSGRGILLVEASLPGMGTLALVRQLRTHAARMPIAVLTSTSDRRISSQAIRAGASEVIEKPLVGEHLLSWLKSQGCRVSGHKRNHQAGM